MYEPKLPYLVVVRSRISPESWEARVRTAREQAVVLKQIADGVKAGELLNHAIARVVPRSRRSWVIRNWPGYQRHGFEAVIDKRIPREAVIAKESGPLIETARQANPRVTYEEVVSILTSQKVSVLPSRSTVKKHFARVDERFRYAQKKQLAAEEVIELPLAGGELMLAAELETGAIAALTDEVVAMGEEAMSASAGKTPIPNVAHRDNRGHFTATYNRKRRRKRGEQIASYLRSAEEKGEGRVPSWPRFVHERRETLEPKLKMLTFSPLVSGTKGWDALRGPEAAGLLPLTGFAYMPSTLSKATSALAISGAGPRLLEAVGKNWHRVAQSRWEEPGAMAALYIDNHTKPVWSSLFTLSGKVSSRNRVMPSITTTYVQTGPGTPVVVSVQSGSAPLAPRLVELVKNAEAKLEGDVRRAVIIDAEGSTFDILEAFSKEGRVIVTPLRPGRAPELELTYSPGSYFRPYRDNDELRIGNAVLKHKSSGRTLELGALLLRREHRESDTVLLTTGLALGMDGRGLTDLYFARWPIQESTFKKGLAVGLDEHRGNCGRMVANIAVVTEVERLTHRLEIDKEQVRKLNSERKSLDDALAKARRAHQRSVDALATRRRRFDALVAQGRTEGKQLGKTAIDQQTALIQTEATQKSFDGGQQTLKIHEAKVAKLNEAIEKNAQRYKKLEPRQTIRKLDVALDSILTATKLTALLLISFALREYLPTMPMMPETFISRLFALRGRRELRPGKEVVVFYENPRDPEVNAALLDACHRLNSRALKRDGRQLRYVVEAAGKYNAVDIANVS